MSQVFTKQKVLILLRFLICLFLCPTCCFCLTIVNGYKIAPRSNLKKADLYDADLTNAQLQYANLSEANLSEAQLQCADLSNADLRGADLKNADIALTVFDGAKLGGALWVNGLYCRKNSIGFCRFIYKAKKKIIKKYIDLKGKDLSNKILDDSNYTRADLRGTNFWKASLKSAKFFKAKLQGACLKSANLHKADLTQANLRGTDLRWANLKDAKLDDALLERTRFEGAIWIDGTKCAKKSIGECIPLK